MRRNFHLKNLIWQQTLYDSGQQNCIPNYNNWINNVLNSCAHIVIPITISKKKNAQKNTKYNSLQLLDHSVIKISALTLTSIFCVWCNMFYMYYVNLKPYHSFTVLFDCEEQFERCIIYSLQTKLVNNPGYPFFLMPIINLVNKYTSLKARDISLHVFW